MSSWRYVGQDNDDRHAKTWRAYHAKQLVCEARDGEFDNFKVAVEAYDHCAPISLIRGPYGYKYERVN